MNSFFQALGIPITRRSNKPCLAADFKVLSAGSKISESEAALFSKLNMRPILHEIRIVKVYDEGYIYDAYTPSCIDFNPFDTLELAIHNISAISAELHYPSLATVPHLLRKGYRNLLCILAVLHPPKIT
jgi:large subunit ribosomal protein LP0